jgi:hypothetical protein
MLQGLVRSFLGVMTNPFEAVHYNPADPKVDHKSRLSGLVAAEAAAGGDSTRVEFLRAVAECVAYGEKSGDSGVFQLFCEKGLMQKFVDVARGGEKYSTPAKVQVIQSMALLIQNIQDERSLFLFLSNNHVNQLIDPEEDVVNPLPKDDEEFLSHYAAFLKAISVRLSPHTIQFFLDEKLNTFPLFWRALSLLRCGEGLVCTSAMSMILHIYGVDEPGVSNFWTKEGNHEALSREMVQLLQDRYSALLSRVWDVRGGGEGESKFSALRDSVSSFQDIVFFLYDMLAVEVPAPALHESMVNHLLEFFVRGGLCQTLIREKWVWDDAQQSPTTLTPNKRAAGGGAAAADKMLELQLVLFVLASMLKLESAGGSPALNAGIISALFEGECRKVLTGALKNRHSDQIRLAALAILKNSLACESEASLQRVPSCSTAYSGSVDLSSAAAGGGSASNLDVMLCEGENGEENSGSTGVHGGEDLGEGVEGGAKAGKGRDFNGNSNDEDDDDSWRGSKWHLLKLLVSSDVCAALCFVASDHPCSRLLTLRIACSVLLDMRSSLSTRDQKEIEAHLEQCRRVCAGTAQSWLDETELKVTVPIMVAAILDAPPDAAALMDVRANLEKVLSGPGLLLHQVAPELESLGLKVKRSSPADAINALLILHQLVQEWTPSHCVSPKCVPASGDRDAIGGLLRGLGCASVGNAVELHGKCSFPCLVPRGWPGISENTKLCIVLDDTGSQDGGLGSSFSLVATDEPMSGGSLLCWVPAVFVGAEPHAIDSRVLELTLSAAVSDAQCRRFATLFVAGQAGQPPPLMRQLLLVLPGSPACDKAACMIETMREQALEHWCRALRVAFEQATMPQAA